jgi:hypothetical protein
MQIVSKSAWNIPLQKSRVTLAPSEKEGLFPKLTCCKEPRANRPCPESVAKLIELESQARTTSKTLNEHDRVRCMKGASRKQRRSCPMDELIPKGIIQPFYSKEPFEELDSTVLILASTLPFVTDQRAEIFVDLCLDRDNA